MALGRPKRARTASKTPQDEGQLFCDAGEYSNLILGDGGRGEAHDRFFRYIIFIIFVGFITCECGEEHAILIRIVWGDAPTGITLKRCGNQIWHIK